MNLRNCSRCGKMFNYVSGQPICEPCKKAIEEDFQKVKQYIADNPRAGLRQIAEDNKFPPNRSSSGSVRRDLCSQQILLFRFSVRTVVRLYKQEDFVLNVRPRWPIILQILLLNRSLCFSSRLSRRRRPECASWILKEQQC